MGFKQVISSVGLLVPGGMSAPVDPVEVVKIGKIVAEYVIPDKFKAVAPAFNKLAAIINQSNKAIVDHANR